MQDYDGWIFAGASDRHWRQALYQEKQKFQNPITQNRGHVRAIRALLEFLPAEVVRSLVVFTGGAEDKTDMPDGVFTLAGCLADARVPSSTQRLRMLALIERLSAIAASDTPGLRQAATASALNSAQ